MDDLTWIIVILVIAVVCGLGGYFAAKPMQGLLCPAGPTNCSTCQQPSVCSCPTTCPTCPTVDCSCPPPTCPTCPDLNCPTCQGPPTCTPWNKAEWPTTVTKVAPKNDTDSDFYVCAVRDGTCVAPVGTPIYYGVNGVYAKKEATSGATPCTVAGIGADPVPGVDKACWVPRSYPPAPTSLANDPRFYKCADNDGTCVAPIGTPIFYGAQTSYVKKVADQNATPCRVFDFGSDPLPGVVKACYVPK